MSDFPGGPMTGRPVPFPRLPGRSGSESLDGGPGRPDEAPGRTGSGRTPMPWPPPGSADTDDGGIR